MIKEVKRLKVTYNQKTVGFLEEIGPDKVAFQYAETWLQEGFSISPFSLPLKDDVFSAKTDYFGGLFGVFHDSLPDSFGEMLLRRKLMKEGINFDRLSTLTRLSLVASNGLGALCYEPHQIKTDTKDLMNLDELSRDIKAIFEHQDVDSFDSIFALGGASGGARPKVHLTIDHQAWIVKFPAIFDPKDSGYHEYQANRLAKEAGIHVNRFKLFPSKYHRGYFGVQRFDRLEKRKVHMISLSSLLETTHMIPNLDYKILFQVIQKISVDQSDIYEAYKRMCFNVLYGNKDDHGKNFAFLYDEKRHGYILSPAYDITKTKNKLEHEMSVLSKGIPKEEDLIAIAKEFHLSVTRCQGIIDTIKKVIQNHH